jgi:hypothetical protein
VSQHEDATIVLLDGEPIDEPDVAAELVRRLMRESARLGAMHARPDRGVRVVAIVLARTQVQLRVRAHGERWTRARQLAEAGVQWRAFAADAMRAARGPYALVRGGA